MPTSLMHAHQPDCRCLSAPKFPNPGSESEGPAAHRLHLTIYSSLLIQYPCILLQDYQSQQLKLMPMLSSCYAFYFASDYLVKRYAEMKMTHDETIVADVHALSAGLKAHITAYTAKVSKCEYSPHHGYASVNIDSARPAGSCVQECKPVLTTNTVWSS